MDSTAFSTISSFIGVIAPSLVIIPFVWIVLKTGSRHVLLYRLWRLTHGGDDIADPVVRDYIQRQTSLMSFRFIAGVHVRTLEGARNLIRWTEENNLQMQEIRLCGPYFDPDARCVKTEMLPSKFRNWATALLGVLLIFIALGLSTILSASTALMQFKESKQWFLLDSTQARIIGSGQSLQASDCTQTPFMTARRTGFAESDVVIICETFEKGELGEFVKKSVFDQRKAIIFLVLFILSVAVMPAKIFFNARAAYAISRKNIDSKVSVDQATALVH